MKMNKTICPKIAAKRKILSCSLFFLLLMLSSLISSCSDSEKEEIPEPHSGLHNNTLTIMNISNIPTNITFDRVEVKITGACWSVITTIEAPWQDGQAVITLPNTFLSNQLQNVKGGADDMCGHWLATSSNVEALVATLGDIIAYRDDTKVGRIYFSNWDGQESSANKAFIYFQYANLPFSLTGHNSTYYYDNCSFKVGWNAYANINPADEDVQGNVRCTTAIPTNLFWSFESWVY